MKKLRIQTAAHILYIHLQKYFADKREEKIALIKGITTGEGFELAPLPQVLSNETCTPIRSLQCNYVCIMNTRTSCKWIQLKINCRRCSSSGESSTRSSQWTKHTRWKS